MYVRSVGRVQSLSLRLSLPTSLSFYLSLETFKIFIHLVSDLTGCAILADETGSGRSDLQWNTSSESVK
jgi:hypothetical protein